jgi:hypothetical protein
LRDVEIRYSNLEKLAYALVKALKASIDYIMHSKIFANVPTSAIKDILTKPNSEGRRGKWISKLQEYDLEIKTTKIIKGQGLAKILVESNYGALDMNFPSTRILEIEPEKDETQEPPLKVIPKFAQSDWYKDIMFYLQNLSFQPSWDKAKNRSIKLKVVNYFILVEKLFWKDREGIFLNFLIE